MGNVRNRGRKSARKVLTPEEAENKKQKKEDSRNRRHSLDDQIVPITPQEIPNLEAKEDNATLKAVGYTEVDIIHPLVDGQSSEQFNNYVTPDANVT